MKINFSVSFEFQNWNRLKRDPSLNEIDNRAIAVFKKTFEVFW